MKVLSFEIRPLGSNWQSNSFGCENGLAPNRWEAIDGTDSLGFNIHVYLLMNSCAIIKSVIGIAAFNGCMLFVDYKYSITQTADIYSEILLLSTRVVNVFVRTTYPIRHLSILLSTDSIRRGMWSY